MPHAWEAHGQKGGGRGGKKYRPLLVKQLQRLLYWLLCKKRLLLNTHRLYYCYVYVCLVHISFLMDFFSTFICCRPDIKTMQHCTPTHGSIPQILTLGPVHLKYNQHCEENMSASGRREIRGKHVKPATASWPTNAEFNQKPPVVQTA